LALKLTDLIQSLCDSKAVIGSVLLKIGVNKIVEVQILQQIFDFVFHSSGPEGRLKSGWHDEAGDQTDEIERLCPRLEEVEVKAKKSDQVLSKPR
jgi:hypothetical protein